MLWVLATGVVGSLPVAWVLGALPWRNPTLLIESMFRGFSACALDAGALTPWRMVCTRAGVPLGMHQLDGGLSYPLAGLFVRLGMDALPAWKLSVALLLVPGFAALFWLGRRLTGSPMAAAVLVVLFGINGTLTARSWNWYWNIVASSLLPIVFALLLAVFERARQRQLRLLPWPGAGAVVVVVLISIEWSYAGLFAAAVAAGALLLLVTQRGWTGWSRFGLVLAGLAGLGIVVAVTQWRLALAEVSEQFGGSVQRATEHSIDLAAFLLPDGAASLLGRALDVAGLDAVLVRRFSDGSQLWVAPYLGVVLLCLFGGLLIARRVRPPANHRCPPRYMTLLVCVTGGSLLLSMGPELTLAGVAAPGAYLASPLAPLWTMTPLRWIRYPWTWNYLTYVALLLALTALTPAVVRRARSWSPLAFVLAAMALLELGSPAVGAALLTPRPSVSTGPEWARISTANPEVARFEATAIPELHRQLAASGGIVTVLPWGNNWITPHLGPAVGIPMRSVGIDRNVRLVQRAAPIPKDELRDPSAETIGRMLDLGWTDTVALLDFVPTGRSVLRPTHHRERPRQVAWQRRSANMLRELARDGFCVERHSWFSLVTRCATSDA